MTLGRLASTLARPALIAHRTVPLGALGIQAVANRAIHRLSELGALGRYAKLTNGPGFARAIANVISELRLEQTEPDALARVVPELCPFLEAYGQEIADHGFTDWPGVLQLAANAAADHGFRHQLLGLPTLLLDVAVTTASDFAIVRALCSRAPETLVTVPANDTNTFARLRSGLKVEIVDLIYPLLANQRSNQRKEDRCCAFSVTFSTIGRLLRRRRSTSRLLSSRPREKAVNLSRLFAGCSGWLAREWPLTKWRFYYVHRRSTDRTSKKHLGAPMCQFILRAVRFAQTRRAVPFTHCSAAPLKISRLGGSPNIFR